MYLSMKNLTVLASLCLLLAGCTKSNSNQESAFISSLQHLGNNPAVSQWYQVAPKGAVNSDGSQWRGLFRKGSENKVIFVFCGGGVSTDQYTAARGSSICPLDPYYVDNMTGLDVISISTMEESFASSRGDNPFKNWSIIFLPYTTGDFHCGTNDYEYTDLDGQKQVLYHHGYTNYRMLVSQVLPHLDKPDALVITGFSAGGFATSILSDDLISFFPDTKNVTICVDASLLIKSDWNEVAKNVWKAPKNICDRITTNNISLASMESLHSNRPEVKILFGVSTYDETLSMFQTYFDNGTRRPVDRKALDVFHDYLKDMVSEFQKQIPTGGLFIWNDILADEELGSTEHTTEFGEELHWNHNGHGSFAKWIDDAVNGQVNTYGLDLLNLTIVR